MTINNKLRENVNSRIGAEVTDQEGIAIARLCRFNFTAIRRASLGFLCWPSHPAWRRHHIDVTSRGVGGDQYKPGGSRPKKIAGKVHVV